MVGTVELGSGLQSVLDLAIQKGSAKEQEAQVVLAVEEPEAFLHPSAQRTLSRLLMNDTSAAVKIVTTHSPIIIEEANYGDVILVRNHEFFTPTNYDEQKRDEINSALMTGAGAELMFAGGVLFVEGEGDLQFLEMLRRRIARKDKSGRTDDLMAVPVGSKTRFGPWIRLVRSYGSGENRPIRWLVVADGDAAQEVRRAFNDATMAIPQEISTALAEVSETEMDTFDQRIRALNEKCRKMRFPLRLLAGDLESAALRNASEIWVINIARKLGWDDINGTGAKDELLRRLGSKAVSNPSDHGRKSPWMRGIIGRDLPWTELAEEVRNILIDWLCLVMGTEEAERLVRNTEQE